MRVVRIEVGPLSTNCWIARGDDPDDPWVVIDPGDEAERILSELGGGRVSAVVLTHAHFDHLGAVEEVVRKTGAPLYVHRDDAHRLTSAEPGGTGGAIFGFDHVSPPADRILEDGDVIDAGSAKFQVLHTPGHTAGGISLLATDGSGVHHLFSGDTLFAGSVGRTDFPAGDARALARSIAEKLSPLPPETLVHPGHGPDTTIARETRVNPFWPRA